MKEGGRKARLMRGKGITYDTGFITEGVSTHEPFDPQVVKREMRIIRDDLHCTTVRITGGHPHRLEIAASQAADGGLEVWFSPFTNELTTDQLLDLLADCAERAEWLRKRGAEVVFVTGAELSLFTRGFLPHRSNPREDFDMASYGVVKVLEDRLGHTYPDMPWEPKAAFTALADYYRGWGSQMRCPRACLYADLLAFSNSDLFAPKIVE
jgi:hypothetical protein